MARTVLFANQAIDGTSTAVSIKNHSPLLSIKTTSNFDGGSIAIQMRTNFTDSVAGAIDTGWGPVHDAAGAAIAITAAQVDIPLNRVPPNFEIRLVLSGTSSSADITAIITH